jgi:hypothetical protein
MQRIFEKALENKKRGEFQMVNATVAEFKPYIFDSEGEFLIGGEKVYNFVKDSIELIEKGAKNE